MDIYEKVAAQGYYLIAEIGVNYYDIARKENISVMDAAKRMVFEAAQAGVDAVKFQTYKADTLAAKQSPSYWDTTEEPTTSQYELFAKFDHFGESEYRTLAAYSCSCGVEFLSTPFDFASADYLDACMPYYKISSSDLSNLPFIEYISKKGKPVLLSTGASNADEIAQAVGVIEKYNSCQLILMHCVLEYPTPYAHANLLKIQSLTQAYPQCLIGYSDHTKPDPCKDVQKTAWLLGARVIEKHFTLDKTLTGNDHYHAMDPRDLRQIKEGLDFVRQLLGEGTLACLPTEQAARQNARRSIVTQGAIHKGQIITADQLTFKRPGIGISPARIDEVTGRIAAMDLTDDTILTWEMLQ